MSQPLLVLSGVSRCFWLGAERVTVLQPLSLTIAQGEMVAIVGVSGSGKSTLLNILGCLDHPTQGRYCIAGHDVATLDSDALAALRCQRFGFIFQRYHLLPHLTARQNVEMAAFYAGLPKAARRAKAETLLKQLGLVNRLDYQPTKLSGGQQQRISIARALINGARVILADEPTGALDKAARQQIIQILQTLHGQGYTVIIVTHDSSIAAQAERVIELADGVIVSDRHLTAQMNKAARPMTEHSPFHGIKRGWHQWLAQGGTLLGMAWLALSTNRLRTLLTLLTLIMGLAAVVSTLLIGSAANEAQLKDLRGWAGNKMIIRPGKHWNDPDPNNQRSLLIGDVLAMRTQPYIDAVAPEVMTQLPLRKGNVTLKAAIQGVDEDYFKAHSLIFDTGLPLTPDQIQRQAQVAVIDRATQERLFADQASVIGQLIVIETIPVQVVGVIEKGANPWDERPQVLVPYTMAANKLLGYRYLDGITVRVQEDYASDWVKQQITQLLTLRHAKKDFFIHNFDDWLQQEQKILKKNQQLLTLTALTALVIAGIGVMNMMLVSVVERTQEIGVRRAVGARYRDILQQFLLEAVLICWVGGVGGVLFSLLIAAIVQWIIPAWQISYSPGLFLSAFFCSSALGMVFGYLPARNAARLDPVDALARE